MNSQIDLLDRIFSALSHPVRRAIIEQVSVKESTVNKLAEPHSTSRPAISQHLRILIDAGIVEQTHQGRIRMCHLNVRPLSAAFNWLVRYRVFWENLLDKIQEQVEADNNNKTEKKTMTKEQDVKGNTLKITRQLRAPQERVYKAFLDPDALAKWIPPHGFTGKVIKSDVRVGGEYRMVFTNFSTGKSQSFGGEYLELKPYTLIRYTDRFDDPSMPEIMETTIKFRKTLAGTHVVIIQKGLPAKVPVEFARAGWQESLQLLELLVVPEIPDES